MSGRKEMLDNTPVAIPLRFKRVETQVEIVRRMVANEFSRLAANQGFESIEDFDDFAIDDEYDPWSPHEVPYDQELGPPIKEFLDGYRKDKRDAVDDQSGGSGEHQETVAESGGKSGSGKGGVRRARAKADSRKEGGGGSQRQANRQPTDRESLDDVTDE